MRLLPRILLGRADLRHRYFEFAYKGILVLKVKNVRCVLRLFL
jgi:hypothetical protein